MPILSSIYKALIYKELRAVLFIAIGKYSSTIARRGKGLPLRKH